MDQHARLHDDRPPARRHVLVAHPEPLLARGVVSTLSQEGGFAAARARFPAPLSAWAWADVIVVDYRDGLALARQAAAPRARPPVAIVIMTTHRRRPDVQAAIEARVHGYLLQDCSIDELVLAVRMIAGGGRYFGVHAACNGAVHAAAPA